MPRIRGIWYTDKAEDKRNLYADKVEDKNKNKVYRQIRD